MTTGIKGGKVKKYAIGEAVYEVHPDGAVTTGSPRPEAWEGARKYFEANLLDGEAVNDCGGAMVRADAVWEVVKEILSRRNEELIEAVQKEYDRYFEAYRKSKHATDSMYFMGKWEAFDFVLSILKRGKV